MRLIKYDGQRRVTRQRDPATGRTTGISIESKNGKRDHVARPDTVRLKLTVEK